MFPNSSNEPPKMSAAVASDYVRKMVAREAGGPGDIPRAMERLARQYGIGFWQLYHLRKGKAKTVEVSLYDKIREAFADHCRRHAERLMHDADMAMAGGNGSDDVAAIQREIQALAARLEAAKGQIQARP